MKFDFNASVFREFHMVPFLSLLISLCGDPGDLILLNDSDGFILPGTEHWRHPNHIATSPGDGGYSNLLADMLVGGTVGVRFSWLSDIDRCLKDK